MPSDDTYPNSYCKGKSSSIQLIEENKKLVDISSPFGGVIANEPGSGLPFTSTVTLVLTFAAKEVVHDNTNENVDL